MLQFMGLQKVEHNLVTEQNQFLDQEQQHLPGTVGNGNLWILFRVTESKTG